MSITTDAPYDASQPPQDILAEQSVLGGMLLSPDAVGEALELVRREDFYRPGHQAVYDAAVTLYSRGETADAITVAAELERRGELERLGGAPYLHTLVAACPSTAFVPEHASRVVEVAEKRRTVEAGQRIWQLGHQGVADPNESIADRARAVVDEITAGRDHAQARQVTDVTEELFGELAAIQDRANGGGALGLPTGFTDLDEVTTGLQAGQFIIVAGRPGLGKSTLGLDFLRSATVRHRTPAALFSLEMSAPEVMMRLYSAEARVRLANMRSGRLSQDDWEALRRRRAELDQAGLPLWIDEDPRLTLQTIRARARRLRQQHNIGLIVVDYMQLLTSAKKTESRQQEVAEISRTLKLLAKELEIPVVAISQLNRGPENRQDKRPSLADLRESGSQEQDADIVILLHRPDAYDRDDPRVGEADLILAKHRAGPQATITVAHQLHYSRFADLAHDQEPPEPHPAFARDNVRPIEPTVVTGEDTSVRQLTCPGCRDVLTDPADRRAGYHRDTCTP
ncbi:replicative DNA helicase [Prauserella sp. PE36]|uniref:replicative DNA helicase n=1 Tax=Prauserella sp. PE36 TaxID=1504709 RepID=UPI000DE41CFA|nr:replicative DNA helicase [Prauserella sp. PE36]RBM18095.1 replicative DNA helicase [Prauserella sp. PE36]